MVSRIVIGKKKKKLNLVDVVIMAVLGIWGIIIIYPFYNSVLVSLVYQKDYTLSPFMLFPKRVTLSAYQYIFSNARIYIGYKNTLIITLLGVPYNMLLTCLTAYSLSRDYFPGKKAVLFFIIFTMFFSGGLIPFYLLVKDLGLIDNLASVILVYGINTFYMLVIKNYFESIPSSIEESARLDGANDFTILFRIILPLSTPMLATFFLFYAVDRWNEWFNAMLFLRSLSNWPLQLALRNMIVTATADTIHMAASLEEPVFSDGVKMASVIVVMAPIMLLYPFLQKYFIKGILIGAIKS